MKYMYQSNNDIDMISGLKVIVLLIKNFDLSWATILRCTYHSLVN